MVDQIINKLLTEYNIPDICIHLTYSGFRRSIGNVNKIQLVNGTNSYPPMIYVQESESGGWKKHAISCDIVMYLLKHSINISTSGDQPTITDSEDFNDV